MSLPLSDKCTLSVLYWSDNSTCILGCSRIFPKPHSMAFFISVLALQCAWSRHQGSPKLCHTWQDNIAEKTIWTPGHLLLIITVLAFSCTTKAFPRRLITKMWDGGLFLWPNNNGMRGGHCTSLYPNHSTLTNSFIPRWNVSGSQWLYSPKIILFVSMYQILYNPMFVTFHQIYEYEIFI